MPSPSQATRVTYEDVQHWMLVTARQFIIEHKGILEKAIIAYAKILPDPDRMDCHYVNMPAVKRTRDKFMSFTKVKRDLYEAAWKILICELEHDSDFHRPALEFIIEELVESVMSGEWQPREVGFPCGRPWGEPRTESEGNYGGYHGRRFAKLIQRKIE